MTMAFLCTRVKDLDEDDYKKLARVIQYLMVSTSMTLTIKPTNSPKWWVDSSYAIHPDF